MRKQRKLAKRYGITVSTVLKWKKRDFVHDVPKREKRRHSTVLSRQEEAFQTAVEFLKELLKTAPYKIHTILTDNRRQFTLPVRSKKSSSSIFDKLCGKEGIRHKLTKPYHPWTNGQVERMNRTIKEAAVYCCYYVSSKKLKQHLHTFLNAYHFAKRLKTLKGLTPYEFIKDYWTQKPEVFKLKPTHLNMKPYTYYILNVYNTLEFKIT